MLVWLGLRAQFSYHHTIERPGTSGGWWRRVRVITRLKRDIAISAAAAAAVAA